MKFKLNNIIKPKTLIIFLSLACLEMFSFLGYFHSELRVYLFVAIALVSLFLAIKNLKYIFLISLSELIVTSYGYLFFIEIGGFKLSLRIALWTIFLAVYFFKIVIEILRNRKKAFNNFKESFSSFPYSRIFLLLFLVIALGVLQGVLSGFDLKTVFSDFNSWLFFLWLLPVFKIFKDNDKEELLSEIFLVVFASGSWLIFKTLFFLFIFSHNIFFLMDPLYRWTRLNYLGEITALNSGFHRIFFQSHIYTLILFLSSFFLIKDGNLKKKERNYLYIFLIASFSVIVLTLSRSLWLGLIFAFLAYAVFLLIKKSYGEIAKTTLIIFSSLLLSFLLIFLVIKLPLAGGGEFSAVSTLKERTSFDEDSGAISSRWNLLPVLVEGITSRPLLGRGFGAELSYESNDPRVLDSNDKQLYTTYAFEWGWLGMCLKIGIFGVLIYCFLLFKIIGDGLLFKKNKIIAFSLAFSLLAVIAINIFTPYFNHPLIIGFVVLSALIMYTLESDLTSKDNFKKIN